MMSKILDTPIKHFNIFLVSKAIQGISNEPTLKTLFTRDSDMLFLTQTKLKLIVS